MPPKQWILILAMLLIGVAWYWITPPAYVGLPRWCWTAMAAGALLHAVRPTGRWLHGAIERVRHPSTSTRTRAAVCIAIGAWLYLTFTAHQQDRDFFPKTQDDQAYAIQTQMLARGRLWMSPHPCADFFDSFHVLSQPVYAPAYFPGTALLYIPLVWLGLPLWVGPIIVSGAVVGLMYRLTSELIDSVAGA